MAQGAARYHIIRLFHLLPLGFCLALFLCFQAPARAAAQEETAVPTLTISADAQFSYAQKRSDQGDFAAAAEEYRRFVHFFPTDPRVETAKVHIGQCLFNEGDFQGALDLFTTVIQDAVSGDPASSENVLAAYWMTARSHTRMGNPAMAVQTLKVLAGHTAHPDVQDQAWYRIGWIHLETAQWEAARAALGRISGPQADAYRVDAVRDRLDSLDELPSKSPGLAGSLSLVPGLGQVYCGRYRDALIAFLVNAALIAVTVEAFDNGNEALGAVTGLLGSGFYAGNIYNAANSAQKFNRDQTARFIRQMQNHLKIDLSAGPAAPGVTVGLRFSF